MYGYEKYLSNNNQNVENILTYVDMHTKIFPIARFERLGGPCTNMEVHEELQHPGKIST